MRRGAPTRHSRVPTNRCVSPNAILVLHDLRGARDDEERVAILLDLGMLVRLAGILDRQIVQPELGLERDPVGRSSGSNSPIQTTWPGFFDHSPASSIGDVRNAFAARIHAGRNDTGLGGTSPQPLRNECVHCLLQAPATRRLSQPVTLVLAQPADRENDGSLPLYFLRHPRPVLYECECRRSWMTPRMYGAGACGCRRHAHCVSHREILGCRNGRG